MSSYQDRRAHSRLVARERASSLAHNASSRAALIAYHDTRAPPSLSNPLPPWARSAQRIALALTPILRTVLYTNLADGRLDGPFDLIVRTDLLQLARVRDLPPRALCGLKTFALLHGWKTGRSSMISVLLASGHASINMTAHIRTESHGAHKPVVALSWHSFPVHQTFTRMFSLSLAPDAGWGSYSRIPPQVFSQRKY